MASQEERDRIMAEYMQGQEGDEEEEAEFEPGNDEDEESDDDDAFPADEEEDYIILKGSVARHDGRLLYKGRVLSETFELKSVEPSVYWEVRQPTRTSADETAPPRTRSIDMEGSLGKDAVKVEMMLTVQENGNSHVTAGKSTGEDDNEDSKMPSKASGDAKLTSVYTVYGKGTTSAGVFEFLGQLDPSTAEHHSIPLECRKRMVSAAASEGAAAAAAVIVDEDDEDDADEGLDYDELIALHQDAGMSVEDLRKRYAGGGTAGDDDDDDDAKPEAKKQKTHEASEDDDDEYGF